MNTVLIKIVNYRRESPNDVIQDEYHHLKEIYSLLLELGVAPTAEFSTYTNNIIPTQPQYGYYTINATPLIKYLKVNKDRAYDILGQLENLLEITAKHKVQFYTLTYNNLYIENGTLKIFPTKEASFLKDGKRYLPRLWTIPPLSKSIYSLPLYREYIVNDDIIYLPDNYTFFAYDLLMSSGKYIDSYLDYWWLIVSVLLNPIISESYKFIDPYLTQDMRNRIRYHRGDSSKIRINNVIRGVKLQRKYICKCQKQNDKYDYSK